MYRALALSSVFEQDDSTRVRANRERILALLDCAKPRILGAGDEPWQPVDAEAGNQISEFFEIFGFNPEQVNTASDLLNLWTSFQLDYSVELRLFMFDREVFDSSLKGKLQPLLEYFTAVVEAQPGQARQLAAKHRIAERLLAGEMAPLLYAVWPKAGKRTRG